MKQQQCSCQSCNNEVLLQWHTQQLRCCGTPKRNDEGGGASPRATPYHAVATLITGMPCSSCTGCTYYTKLQAGFQLYIVNERSFFFRISLLFAFTAISIPRKRRQTTLWPDLAFKEKLAHQTRLFALQQRLIKTSMTYPYWKGECTKQL